MHQVHDARRLVIWRHGRTSWNAEQRFQGQTDIDLDETGIAQAERAAGMLASLRPALIVSSDLRRARDTAEPLARLLGTTVHEDPGLRETFAGAWEGLTRIELEQLPGPSIAEWAVNSQIRPGVTGETRLEVATRVVAAIERALVQVPDGGCLVVVTHGGAARAGIGALLGLPSEHWAILGVLSNASWSVLIESRDPSLGGPPWRLAEYNAGTLPEPALADDR